MIFLSKWGRGSTVGQVCHCLNLPSFLACQFLRIVLDDITKIVTRYVYVKERKWKGNEEISKQPL
jgi:hypothetical protein